MTTLVASTTETEYIDTGGGGGEQSKGVVHNNASDSQHNRSKEAIDNVKSNEKSYSDKLKANVRYDQRLKRNVLEITLEKTNDDAVIDNVGPEDIARVLKTVGIDLVSQVQGYQVHYKGRFSIISIWMAAGVSLPILLMDNCIGHEP